MIARFRVREAGPPCAHYSKTGIARPFCADMSLGTARGAPAVSRKALMGVGRGSSAAVSGWLAGPFHHLAGPFTTSRAAYRDKCRSYSRVLVKGQGKW